MEPLALDQYQAVALRTAKPLTLEMNLMHAGLGLTSEAGEIASAIKAHAIYGKELDIINQIEEAGDVLWFLTLLCHTLGLTLEEIAAANIAKLSRRYPDLSFNVEHALNRDLGGEAQALSQVLAK